MSTRSISPRISCSEPIGISVATTCWPKAPFSDSSVRKKSARSRSSMFTKTSRATPSSCARSHRRRVETSTPITPLTTKIADSHTRNAPSASAMKLGSPGVSIRLTFTSRHSNEASDAEMDMPRDFSSSSASETVVPSATEPSRVVAPASNSRASCNDVFPLPRWPTSATLRILSAACGIAWRSSLYEAREARLSLVAKVVSLQPRLEPQNGLCVQLGDARLGHAEDLADLSERQVFVVVEGDHELLALRQGGDGVGQPVLELGRREHLLRIRRVRVVERVEQAHGVAGGVAHGPQLVERDHGRVGDLDEDLLELLDRHLQLACHLLVGRRPVQPVLELRVDLLDLPRPRAHRPGNPVQRTQLVDDRALDPRDRVRLELDLTLELEALDRVDQADQPVRDEIGVFDVRGKTGGHPAGDVLHEW